MDAVEYKNGAKNQWRRTAWNLISQVITDRRNALVLYLPGLTDLDRVEALRRGFQPANLIAVERDKSVAVALRKKGVTVVQGTLNQVLRCWPAPRRIDLIIADFQCGITREVKLFATYCATHPALTDAHVLINLQRGRDTLFKDSPVAFAWQSNGLPSLELPVPEKSRAAAFSQLMFVDYMKEERLAVQAQAQALGAIAEARSTGPMVAGLSLKELDAKLRIEKENLRIARKAKALVDDFFFARPLPSYRSTPASPLFDSMLLSWRGLTEVRSQHWKVVAAMDDGHGADKHRNIAAALAIRTRRLRGELRATA